MTLEDLAVLGELIAAIGVIVSLIYLTRQVAQNNKLLASQARYNLIVRRSDMVDSSIQPDALRALFKYAAGEEVTPMQRGTAQSLAGKTIEMWQWQFSEYRAGMLERRELPVSAWSRWYHDEGEIPYPIKEVFANRRTLMDPEFVAFIDENVDRHPGGGS